MEHPDEDKSPVVFFPRFPVDPLSRFAVAPMDVGGLPALRITIEESEDLNGWGTAKAPA